MSHRATNCSALLPPSLLLVGPGEEAVSLGPWSVPLFSLLSLHLLPVLLLGIRTLRIVHSQTPSPLLAPLTWLTCLPPSLLLLTSTGVLFPSLGKYVELALEVAVCLGLVKFLQLTLAMCGGADTVLQHCKERDTGLPIGSPPLVCLLPFKRPAVSGGHLSLVCLAPSLLLLTKVTILGIEVAYLALGYTRGGKFLAWDNSHNLASLPAGILGIYFYNIYMTIISGCMGDHQKRHLGIILLLQYILFDCLKLFTIFLTGTGMLSCVPPYISEEDVGHILKNVMKAFLATGLGLPFLNICAGSTDFIPQLVHGEPQGFNGPGATEDDPKIVIDNSNGLVSNLNRLKVEVQRSI